MGLSLERSSSRSRISRSPASEAASSVRGAAWLAEVSTTAIGVGRARRPGGGRRWSVGGGGAREEEGSGRFGSGVGGADAGIYRARGSGAEADRGRWQPTAEGGTEEGGGLLVAAG
uniref:Uncharacterized protein n=1 Tax=Arundo donax TaxID=35708 RepID=A0A0A9EZ09_ARUDO